MPTNHLIAESFVSLPTDGVYAETLLSKYSSTEQIDLSRRVDYKYMEMVQASEIEGVSAASRRSTHLDTTSTGVADSVMGVQTAEAAPPGPETAAMLDSLSKFQDMSHLTASIEAANKGLE